MSNEPVQPDGNNATLDGGDSAASLRAQLSVIERTTSAAHAAIDNLANRADVTLRKVRDMASRASGRFQRGCESYSAWEDERVEEARERIRARPLTAVALGVLIGCLLGRISRS